MPVNHEVRTQIFSCFPARRFSQHDGMAGGWTHFRLQPDLPAMCGQPVRAGDHVAFMLRLRGDAGEAQKFAQFRDKAGLVAFEVIEHSLHGNEHNRGGAIFQSAKCE